MVKIVFDFKVKSFIHAVLMLDSFRTDYAWVYLSDEDKRSYLQNVNLYIGDDSEIATNNQLCQGGPFLDINDPKNYFDDTTSNNSGNLKPWKYG